MRFDEKAYGLMCYRLTLARANGALDAGNGELAASLFECAEFLRDELIDRLGTIEDEQVRKVMSLRYVHGLEWSAVAERMCFSLRWVMRLHQRGLEEL